jgi:phospholipid transport system substrate-binding protein
MSSSRRFLSACLGLFGLLLAGAADGAAAATLDPAAFVERIGVQAIDGLTVVDLSTAERKRRFADILEQSFDVPTIGRMVLGRYWRVASEAERAEFLRLFKGLLVETYAARFAEYAGERLQVDGVRRDGDHAVVHSSVIRPTAESIRVDWRLEERDGAFKVVDVAVEGISMVVTQRADFGAAIQSMGGAA